MTANDNHNNKYANQTIHNFLTTQWPIRSQSLSSNHGTWNSRFYKFRKIPKKDWIPRKVQTQTRGDLNSWKRQKLIPVPTSQPPFINWAWRPWYEVLPPASLGWLPPCAPSQLLRSCSLAEHEKLDKVPDSLATTENISVTNILLVLNPKHSYYWEENQLSPTWSQDKGIART